MMALFEAIRNKFLTIDTHVIPAKFACLLIGLHMGSYIPYLNVFFTSVGLSKFQAGIITGLRNVLPIISGPLWGYLADNTGRRKLILFILCFGASVPLFSMPWVAREIYPKSRFHCNSTNTTHGWNRATEDCEHLQMKCIATLFHVFVALMTTASLFLQPLPYYVNTIVIDVVMTSPMEATYGGQWVFTTIGIALGNFVAGKAADHFNEIDMSPYTEIFYLFLPCTFLFLPIGSYMIGQVDYSNGGAATRKKYQYEEISISNREHDGRSLYRQVFRQLRRFDVLFFMSTVLISGIASNIFTNFSYLLVTDVMKRGKGDMALVISTATLSGIFILPFTSTVMKVLRGTYPAIVLATFTYFVRFLVMSYDIPFTAFVAIQILSALSYALSWAAFIEHINMTSPQDIKTTMNALMFTVFSSIGSLLANIGGSKLYEKYGGRHLFFMESVLCLIWTVIMLVYYGGKMVKRCVRDEHETVLPVENVKGYDSINGIDNATIERDRISVHMLYSNSL